MCTAKSCKGIIWCMAVLRVGAGADGGIVHLRLRTRRQAISVTHGQKSGALGLWTRCKQQVQEILLRSINWWDVIM